MARPAGLPDRAHFEAMPCGSRAKYIGARCRCMLCRAANSRYQSERARAIKAGEDNPLVSAFAARAHLLWLSRRGVGRRAVAAACDIGPTTLQQISAGEKLTCRKATERRILAVTVDAVSDHGLVSAKRAHKRIAVLLDEGFSKADIARRLGYKVPALQLNAKRVIAKNAVKVERLYQQVMAE